MIDGRRTPDVVADFWLWYERRQRRERGALGGYALDQCEEAFRQKEWERFGYWFSIYCRERSTHTRAN
jgi:hypothetical protein